MRRLAFYMNPADKLPSNFIDLPGTAKDVPILVADCIPRGIAILAEHRETPLESTHDLVVEDIALIFPDKRLEFVRHGR